MRVSSRGTRPSACLSNQSATNEQHELACKTTRRGVPAAVIPHEQIDGSIHFGLALAAACIDAIGGISSRERERSNSNASRGKPKCGERRGKGRERDRYIEGETEGKGKRKREREIARRARVGRRETRGERVGKGSRVVSLRVRSSGTSVLGILDI